MTRNIETEAEINSIRLIDQVSDPSNPSADHVSLYVKNGGIHVIDSAGDVSIFSYPMLTSVYKQYQNLTMDIDNYVEFNTEVIDDLNMYSVPTSRLIIPSSGLYHIDLTVILEASWGGSTPVGGFAFVYTMINNQYPNDSLLGEIAFGNEAIGSQTYTQSVTKYLSQGDTIAIDAYPSMDWGSATGTELDCSTYIDITKLR